MKKILFIYIAAFLSVSIFASESDEIFKEIGKEISGLGSSLRNGTIAVFPLETPGASGSAYGNYAADKIASFIIKEGTLKLVERERLNSIIIEKELSMIGVVEENEARKIGKLLSVDAVVVGSIYRTEKGREISVRVIDTQSGQILALITRNYTDTSQVPGEKKKSGFTGTWKVTATAPYLKERGMNYEKLILNEDGTFSLFLINNADRYVEIKGRYWIDNNNIDYMPLEMYMDNERTYFQKKSRRLEGTIYLVKDELHFNYVSMGTSKRTRLDANNPLYRCIAESVE